MGILNQIKKLTGKDESKSESKKDKKEKVEDKTVKMAKKKESKKKKTTKKKTTKPKKKTTKPKKKTTKKKTTKKKTTKKKTTKSKKDEMYFCLKCDREHTESSKIGKNHYDFRLSDDSFFCEKCEIRHNMSSKIGKKHKKYDLTKKSKKKKTKEAKKREKKLSKKRMGELLRREDIKELIHEIADEKGYKLFKHLVEQGKEINEFKLAEKVGVQINRTRSFLYRLYERNLVSFSRERDKEKGWFIYSWKADMAKLKEMILNKKDEEIARLKRIEMEAQQFFRCKSCEKDFSYVEAMESTFFCPVCGDYLEAIETDEMHKEIKNKIDEIIKDKKEIEEI